MLQQTRFPHFQEEEQTLIAVSASVEITQVMSEMVLKKTVLLFVTCVTSVVL